MAKTSDRVSSLAARYINITSDQLFSLSAMPKSRERLAEDIQSMAASLLRQDEVGGLRRMLRKVMG